MHWNTGYKDILECNLFDYLGNITSYSSYMIVSSWSGLGLVAGSVLVIFSSKSFIENSSMYSACSMVRGKLTEFVSGSFKLRNAEIYIIFKLHQYIIFDK